MKTLFLAIALSFLASCAWNTDYVLLQEADTKAWVEKNMEKKGDTWYAIDYNNKKYFYATYSYVDIIFIELKPNGELESTKYLKWSYKGNKQL